MTVKETLIAIISGIQDKGVCDPVDFYDTGYTVSNERLAEHLIANGVTVQTEKE